MHRAQTGYGGRQLVFVMCEKENKDFHGVSCLKGRMLDIFIEERASCLFMMVKYESLKYCFFMSFRVYVYSAIECASFRQNENVVDFIWN